ERAVEEVAEPGNDQEKPGRTRPTRGERARGQEAHAETDDGEMVGAQVQPEQGAAHRVGPRADALAVAPQHRQIDCPRACSSASRARSSVSGSSIFRPSWSCT